MTTWLGLPPIGAPPSDRTTSGSNEGTKVGGGGVDVDGGGGDASVVLKRRDPVASIARVTSPLAIKSTVNEHWRPGGMGNLPAKGATSEKLVAFAAASAEAFAHEIDH